jgi:hypothetical protein
MAGVDQAWFDLNTDDSAWLQVTPRSVQEGDIWNSYDGWGWYRKAIEIPEHWKDTQVRLVFESVDDMYELYVNGRRAGGYGQMDRSESEIRNVAGSEPAAVRAIPIFYEAVFFGRKVLGGIDRPPFHMAVAKELAATRGPWIG